MKRSIKRNINNKKKSRKRVNLYGGSKCNDLKSHSPEEYKKICEHNSSFCIWCKTYCRNRPQYKDDNFEIIYPKDIKSFQVGSPSKIAVKPVFVSRKSPIKPVVPTSKSPIKPVVASSHFTSKRSGFADSVPIVGGEQKNFSMSDIVAVPGDGTCLFHSVVIGLKTLGLYQGTGHTLRQEVAKYLKDTLNNGNRLDVPYQSGSIFSTSKENDLSFKDYLFAMDYVPKGGNAEKFMQQHISAIAQNKWGTEIELWAISKMFPMVNYEVYSYRPESKYLRLTSGGNESNNMRYPTIRIFNKSGNSSVGIHYDALPASRQLI
jgi:hypothetical protein